MRLAWLVALAGCSFTRGAPPATADGAPADSHDAAIIDSAIVGDATACFDVDGVSLQICLAHSPAGTTTIPTEAITTAAGEAQCEALTPNSDQACVISGDTVNVAAAVTLQATGPLPLVLIAGGAITIDGTIDVASRSNGQIGPLANDPACSAGTQPTSRGGGAGGSYGSKGGNGGDESGAAGTHGSAGGTVPIALHGGCPGQTGAATGGPGGSGGGVVILIAPTITITGAIDASGAGGSGAPTGTTRGGGGGGSGGLIVLQGMSIQLMSGGQVFANGGGGGGGTNNSSPGGPGDDPVDATTKPNGGGAGGMAGKGGDGAYGTHNAGTGANGTSGSDGGGGGGGGEGIVHIPAGAQVQGGNAISPNPS